MVVMLVAIVLFSVIKFDAMWLNLRRANRFDAARRRAFV
jgi:uncharacterized protein YqhQ